jgi:glycosyltransferase involved in cell wall biosynthesis
MDMRVAPVERSKLSPDQAGSGPVRLGWFSSWNSRCGLAEYSKYLLQEFDADRFDWTILASNCDQTLGADDQRVVRCWTNSAGSVQPLLNVLIENCFDVLVVQFKIQVDFGFLSLPQLETLIACCHALNTRVVLMLHATDGADLSGDAVSFRRIVGALRSVDRIFVHSPLDVERLATFGVSTNVELISHGYASAGVNEKSSCRSEFGLPEDAFIVGSHGFLLPNKGIDRLIEAFARFRQATKNCKLVLATALYPIHDSEQHLRDCQALAANLGIAEDVVFESRFLPIDHCIRLLGTCDVIVYPYQLSAESSSAAVRAGIASGRPNLCSPLPIFSDVSQVVHYLKGINVDDICEGLASFQLDSKSKSSTSTRQLEWVEQNSWKNVTCLLQAKITELAPTPRQTKNQHWLARYISNVLQDSESFGIAMRARVAELQAKASMQEDRITALEKALASTIDNHAIQLNDVYQSTSWRVTRPIRQFGKARKFVQAKGLYAFISAVVARLKLLIEATITQRLTGRRDSVADLSPRATKIWHDLKQASNFKPSRD